MGLFIVRFYMYVLLLLCIRRVNFISSMIFFFFGFWWGWDDGDITSMNIIEWSRIAPNGCCICVMLSTVISRFSFNGPFELLGRNDYMNSSRQACSCDQCANNSSQDFRATDHHFPFFLFAYN